MNEDISQYPLYKQIMMNRCLTCYKEVEYLIPLTEYRFLKELVPEITLTSEDYVCEECDDMVKSMITFRNTVLTAQLLFKTAYEQQCLDFEEKISVTNILKYDEGLERNSDSEDTLSIDSIKIEELDSEDPEGTTTFPITTWTHKKKGTITESNEVTSNTSKIYIKTSGTHTKMSPAAHSAKVNNKKTPGKVDDKNIIGKVDVKNITGKVDGKNITGKVDGKNITGKVDGKNIAGEVGDKNITGKVDDKNITGKVDDKNITGKVDVYSGTVPVDGQLVMSDNVHELTVKVMSEAAMRADRDNKSSRLNYTSKLKCESCITTFRVSASYEEHMKLHDLNAGEHMCDICNLRFADIEDMATHRQLHYIKYMCSKCEYGIESLILARQHYNRKHYVYKRSCNKCDAEFETNKELLYHKRWVHGRKVNCEQCGVMVSDSDWNAHMARHNGDVPRVKCKVCDKLLRRRYINHHMLQVHGENQDYTCYCKPCDKLFRTKTAYVVHMKQSLKHNGENLKFKCEECGKQLGSRASVQLHMEAMHSNTPKYQCDQCDQVFKTRVSRRRHVKLNHSTVERARNVICDHCGKAFYDKRNLSAHMTVHTRVRAYACVECDATFGFKAALYTHRRLKHKIKRKKDLK